MELPAQLSPKQQKALSLGTKRLNYFEGAVRSSKTFTMNLLWVQHVLSFPYPRFLMTGVSKSTIKRNVLLDVIDLIGSELCKYNSQDGELTIKGYNKTIYCIGTEEECSEKKVFGLTVGGWYGDEITRTPKSVVSAARSRCSVDGSKIFWTSNPDSPYHFIKKEYIDVPNPDYYVEHFGLDDNPSLSEAIKNELKKTYTGIFYQRMIEGKWVLAEGIIYKVFSAQNIVPEELIKYEDFTHFWASSDYGTASTTVFHLFGLRKDGVVVCLKEFTHDALETNKQLTDDEFADILINFCDPFPVICVYIDPSAASFILKVKEKGFYVKDAKNDVLDGIRVVSSGFYTQTFVISSACVKTIGTISHSYVWDEKAQLRGIDRPLKQNDHHCDSIRYGFYSWIESGGQIVTAGKGIKLSTLCTLKNIPQKEIEVTNKIQGESKRWLRSRLKRRNQLLGSFRR